MVTASAVETLEDAVAAARSGPPVRFRLRGPIADGLLEQLAGEFELWFEDGDEGEVIITGPAGGKSSEDTFEVNVDIGIWVRLADIGKGRDSQGGYDPPLGRRWIPDASWLSDATLAKLTESQMRGAYWPVAPDFVVEVVSPSQDLADQQAKMRDWIAAEVRLGMLISPDDELVELYWADGRVEAFDRPDAVSCDPVMPGFTLRFDRIWR